MRRKIRSAPVRPLAAGIAAAALLLGCESDPVQPPAAPNRTDVSPSGERSAAAVQPSDRVIMPDFALEDRNSASATYGSTVSPRQFMGAISAYYFGFAT